MKKFVSYLIIFACLTILLGSNSCDKDDEQIKQSVPNQNINPESTPKPPSTEAKGKITIGSTVFEMTFYNNETTTAFKKLLPMTIHMSELNGNEKYYGLSQSLPTNASNPGTIENGDLMLYGSSTLVLFYKTFSTSYSYTRIGSVDNPSGLQDALGAGNVTVMFEMQ